MHLIFYLQICRVDKAEPYFPESQQYHFHIIVTDWAVMVAHDKIVELIGQIISVKFIICSFIDYRRPEADLIGSYNIKVAKSKRMSKFMFGNMFDFFCFPRPFWQIIMAFDQFIYAYLPDALFFFVNCLHPELIIFCITLYNAIIYIHRTCRNNNS